MSPQICCPAVMNEDICSAPCESDCPSFPSVYGSVIWHASGHHAGPNGLLEAAVSCGFCIFNNIAVGALHALQHHGLDRVAIVDTDVSASLTECCIPCSQACIAKLLATLAVVSASGQVLCALTTDCIFVLSITSCLHRQQVHHGNGTEGTCD